MVSVFYSLYLLDAQTAPVNLGRDFHVWGCDAAHYKMRASISGGNRYKKNQ